MKRNRKGELLEQKFISYYSGVDKLKPANDSIAVVIHKNERKNSNCW